MAKRHYYAIKARRHERAAAKARSSHDREGHKIVAHGYHKLARGSTSKGKAATFHFKKGKRVRGRRRGKKGRFI